MKSFLSCLCTLIIALCISVPQAIAQDAGRTAAIRDTTVTLSEYSVNWLSSKIPLGKPTEVVIKFAELPSANTKKEMAASGILIQEFLGDNSFLAIIERKAIMPKTGLPFQLLALFPTNLKISKALKGEGSAKLKVTVILNQTTENQELLGLLQKSGLTNIDTRWIAEGMLSGTIQKSNLEALAKLPVVRAIDADGQPEPLNGESQGATKTSVVHAAMGVGGWALKGEGMTIGVGDNGTPVNHADVKDRVINFFTFPSSNHGIHVSGTVGGAGNIDQANEGFSSRAIIVSHLYDNVLVNTPTMRSDYGMSVTNNSYGLSGLSDCDILGSYTGNSFAMDNLALAYPDVSHVFAAGNSGSITCAPYPFRYKTISGHQQSAKNVVSVANVNKNYIVALNSSRGPLQDGRLKPDISAIGSGVFSTFATDAYGSNGGTSMASPMIAAGISLLQQRHKQLFGGSLPTNHLSRVLLLNGAMDLGRPGPDFEYGFGIMNLRRSLLMLDNVQYKSDVVAPAMTNTYSISIPANTAKLKVMLTWDDVAGSPLAMKQLVNDLDLTLTSPSAVLHRPLILNPAPSNVTDNAVEGEDHLNNTEQVTLISPAAGTYTVKVKGTSLPSGARNFAISWDAIPNEIFIAHPYGGYAVRANQNQRIYWDASDSTLPFQLEWSGDDGLTWDVITASIGANERQFSWLTPDSSCAKAKLRLTRGAQVHVTDAFPMNRRPEMSFATKQCIGYIAVKWLSIPQATGYELLRKKGFEMEVVSTTIDTNFVYTGLDKDSTYYVAVRPLFGGISGYRSYALIRQPNVGNCDGSYSDNDLAISKIITPLSGRKATSTELTASEALSIEVRNNDDVAHASYNISYRINGGAWVSTPFAASIPANSASTVNVATLNLSTVNNYHIDVAVQNTAAVDPSTWNDSVSFNVRQIDNVALALVTGYLNDFEAMGNQKLVHDSIGFTPDARWDYINPNPNFKLSTFLTAPLLIGGSRSLHLDAVQVTAANTNALVGTFNLAGLSVATDDIRLGLKYRMPNAPATPDSNAIYIRGSDAQPWVKLFNFSSTLGLDSPTVVNSLPISQALMVAGQTLGSSMQVKIVQRDQGLLASPNSGNGLVIDDILLFKVSNDVALQRIIAPIKASCNVGSSTPITVKIYNNSNAPQSGIVAYYKLNAGSIASESVPSIPANDSLTFTFTSPLSPLLVGANVVSTWVALSGDDFKGNDSATNYIFHNQAIVAAFPYLENFESSNGSYFSEGMNDDWGYGEPVAGFINKAASGSKAWVTNLAGLYTDNQMSYLNTPCFQTSSLTNPTLSFSYSSDIEGCGAVGCDGAWVEWSDNNGLSWIKLGSSGSGTNWYSNSTFQVWAKESQRWQVATFALPVTTNPLRLRFVFSSDIGTHFEGFAVDDIHIYSKDTTIYAGATTGLVSATPSLSAFTPFLSGGNYFAAVNPLTSVLGSTDVQQYSQPSMINLPTNQYYLRKSYTINSASTPLDSVDVRFYIKDTDVKDLLAATGCATCTKPEDVYRLGITQYDGINENGDLSDNATTGYTFHPSAKVKWVPYDDGYYAQLRVKGFSEFYFNNGSINNATPLPVEDLIFSVKKLSNSAVKLEFGYTGSDTQLDFELERSKFAGDFQTFASLKSLNKLGASFIHIDTTANLGSSSTFYRLKYTTVAGKKLFARILRVDWEKGKSTITIYPNPIRSGNQLHLDWLPSSTNTNLKIKLTNTLGKQLKIWDFDGKSVGIIDFQLPDLAAGIYYLHTYSDGLEQHEKIVVASP